MKYYRSFALVLALTLSAYGCGGTNFGPVGSVKGTLTMDGKPLATGTQLLFMQMEQGYAAFAHTDDAGTYELKWMREGSTRTEVPVGEYKILVQPPEVKDVEELSADEMLDGGAEDIQPAEPDFPKKYQQHSTSGLTFSVKEGANTCDLDLKSE